MGLLRDFVQGYENGRVCGEVSNILAKNAVQARGDIMLAVVTRTNAELDMYEAVLEHAMVKAWTYLGRGKAEELLNLLRALRYG